MSDDRERERDEEKNALALAAAAFVATIGLYLAPKQLESLQATVRAFSRRAYDAGHRAGAAAEARVKELEASQNTDWRGMALNHSKTIARQISERDAMRRDVGSQADRITALEAQVAVKDEALHAAKSQLTQYWAYLSSDRVEDAEAILDAALAPAATKETP